MPLTDRHIELFRSICIEWNKAEQDIKLAELVCSEVVNPAVKELRYAGRRIIDAVQALDAKGSEEEARGFLDDARFDCYRARHDAIDVATAKMAKDTEIMVDKIKYDAILKAYPKFPEFYGALDAIRKKIAQSRGNRQDRELIYSSIENTDLPNLIGMFQSLRSCESMMINMAKSDRREKLLSRVIAVIAVLIALITLLWNIFFKK